MPSSSNKQFQLMARACRDADFAKQKGIKQSDACEWVTEDYRLACQNPDHALVLGMNQSTACKRLKQRTQKSEPLDIREQHRAHARKLLLPD